VESLLAALGLVFVAELGDKTQLVALGFGARHRLAPVLAGVTIAYMATNLLSVLVGGLLGATLPTRAIGLGGGVLFLGFAAWTLWRGGGDDDGESVTAGDRSVVLSVAAAMFVAELGDKTMLATVTLASDHNWAGVWIGATAGMVLADGVAIAAGALLHTRLPAQFLHSLASVLFLVFGLWLLFDGALGLRWVAVAVTGSVVAGVGTVSLVRFVRRRKPAPAAAPSLQSP
jgi:putative Ca2+/H+ antiporter (TMEM165/GDT1 family)